MLSLRPLALAALALAVTSFAGCVPTVWLPDSSGFIYVKPVQVAGEASGQLVHYDLQKKTSRVIVEDIGKATVWPALSPVGKRIAVARLTGGPKQAKTVKIVMYDFQGKKGAAQIAGLFLETAAQGKQSFHRSDAWDALLVAKNDMVVVTDGNVSGLYDVKKDSFKVIDKSMPLIHGGSRIRPDGCFDFAGDMSAKVTQFKDGQRTFSKVFVVNHKSKKEELLLDKGPQMALHFPSPDGNYLNLSLTDLQPGEDDIILVFSQKGEVVSKLVLPR
jgi:hypothetical protein